MWDALLGAAKSGISSGLSSALSGAVSGLFGGGSKGPSIYKQMEAQRNVQQELAMTLPYYQTKGLRDAGLNPILVAGHGPATGQQPTGAVADPTIASAASLQARSMAGRQAKENELTDAQILQSNSAAKLNESLAIKAQAEAETERNRPENVAAETGYKRSLTTTEGYRPGHISQQILESQQNIEASKQNVATGKQLEKLYVQQGLTEQQRRAVMSAEIALSKTMQSLNVTRELREKVDTAVRDMDFHVAKQAAQEAFNKGNISSTTLGNILSGLNHLSRSLQGK